MRAASHVVDNAGGRSYLRLPIFTASLPHPWRTPFDLSSARRPVRHATMPLLEALTRELERQAARLRPTSLLISSFPEVEGALARIDSVYQDLASDLAFVAALAPGMTPRPGPGLRGVSIRDDDPLCGTRNVDVIGPHFAAMLAAREHGHAASTAEQTFDFVFTSDRGNPPSAWATRCAASRSSERPARASR